jgi:Mg-chelatase subunit ChlI
MRQAIVRRRIEFDRNPEVFSKKWSVSENLLSEQIAIARSCIAEITIPDAMLALAVRLSLEVKVQGHRYREAFRCIHRRAVRQICQGGTGSSRRAFL